ncbi:hypothetical protein AB0R12_17015 [Streptomyces niveus]|uniref:hypothetical protein n=1 Tax=Streptomyces niveus TaxID=193462 RepID=UPI00343C5658
MTTGDVPGMVREKMIVEYPADTHLSQSSTTPGGRNGLLRDEDNQLVGHSVLYPADDDVLTRAEAKATHRLAVAGAAVAGAALTYAAVKAAPHVRKGLANLKSKLNRGEPELAEEKSVTIIEIEFPGRTARGSAEASPEATST